MGWYTDNGYSQAHEDKMTGKTTTVTTSPKTVYEKAPTTTTSRPRSTTDRRTSDTSTYNGQTFTTDYVNKLKDFASDPAKALAELTRVKNSISGGNDGTDAVAHYQRINSIVSADKKSSGGPVPSIMDIYSSVKNPLGVSVVGKVDSGYKVSDIPFNGGGMLGGSVPDYVETYTNLINNTLTEEDKNKMDEQRTKNESVGKSDWFGFIEDNGVVILVGLLGFGIVKTIMD